MAEPITMTLSALLWEYGLKPIADSIKKEYGDETKKLLKSSLQKAFKMLSLQPKEQKIIEAEIKPHKPHTPVVESPLFMIYFQK
jgi:hypothetical protein